MGKNRWQLLGRTKFYVERLDTELGRGWMERSRRVRYGVTLSKLRYYVHNPIQFHNIWVVRHCYQRMRSCLEVGS